MDRWFFRSQKNRKIHGNGQAHAGEDFLGDVGPSTFGICWMGEHLIAINNKRNNNNNNNNSNSNKNKNTNNKRIIIVVTIQLVS